MFVMNLDRAPDRWKYMTTVLDEQGLTAERLPAVDGKNLTDDEMRTQSTKMAAFLQPRGVIGCYLSHKRFWQLVVDRNLPEAIIFEDDVRLVDGFKDRLGDFLRRLQAEGNKPYDVLLLGAIGRVHPEGKDNIGSRFFSSYIGGKRRLEMVSEFVYKPRRPAGTHAYMVSNSGARRLLGLCPKATFHVDLDVSARSTSPRLFVFTSHPPPTPTLLPLNFCHQTGLAPPGSRHTDVLPHARLPDLRVHVAHGRVDRAQRRFAAAAELARLQARPRVGPRPLYQPALVARLRRAAHTGRHTQSLCARTLINDEGRLKETTIVCHTHAIIHQLKCA